jgi:hypothetical protein
MIVLGSVHVIELRGQRSALPFGEAAKLALIRRKPGVKQSSFDVIPMAKGAFG